MVRVYHKRREWDITQAGESSRRFFRMMQGIRSNLRDDYRVTMCCVPKPARSASGSIPPQNEDILKITGGLDT